MLLVTQHAALVGEAPLTLAALKGSHVVVHVHVALVVALHHEALVAEFTPVVGVVLVVFAHMAFQAVLCLEESLAKLALIHQQALSPAILRGRCGLQFGHQLLGVSDAAQGPRPVVLNVLQRECRT